MSAPSQTSGTASFNPDMMDIYEMVAERAGLDFENNADGRSGYNLRQFRRDYNLLSQEMSNRGLNLGTFQSQILQLQPTQYSYLLPPDTLDVLDGYIRTNAGTAITQTDFLITRYSQMQYDRIPNKLTPGRPLNWLLQRLTSTITVVFWPVPDASLPYTFVYERLRRIQDAGAFTNNVDYPYRALPVIVAGLTFYMALRKPALMPRVQTLKTLFEEQFKYYRQADSDRSTFRMIPASNLSHR